ncbi:hypothetical protein [Kiloniella sp.]|uniref:hypothetical protein n=1 Tax=Kiloniella sp. TaxID=1938587 RepID=UPI003B0255A8
MGGKAVYNETVAETEEGKRDLRPWWLQLADNLLEPEEEEEEEEEENSSQNN